MASGECRLREGRVARASSERVAKSPESRSLSLSGDPGPGEWRVTEHGGEWPASDDSEWHGDAVASGSESG